MTKKYRSIAVLFLCAMSIVTTGNASDAKEWSMARSLCGDPKARKIGDLLTVIIEEEGSAEVNAKNSSSKKSTETGEISVGHPKIDDRPTAWTNASIPAWNLQTESTFDGSGKMQNNNKLTSQITVRVTDIAPNGNLIIEGKRLVVMQDENVTVITTGTVRPTDVSRENTIQSSRIADTAVRYASAGTVTHGQERGWLMSILNVINPF